jgi:hypothetical protein
VSAFGHVAGAVLRRNLIHAFKNPALFVPALVFPMIFLIAFAGGLSSVGNVPGFDYPPGYTTFQFAFVFLQSAAFGGVFTGFAGRGRLGVGLRPAPPARGPAAHRDHRRLRRAAMVPLPRRGRRRHGRGARGRHGGRRRRGELVGLVGLALLFNVTRRSGGPGWRCASSRCRPGRRCRSRSS